MRTASQLGQALGNRTRRPLVRRSRLRALTVDRKVMASVMETHRLRGHPLSFAPAATLFISRAARGAPACCGGGRRPVHPTPRDLRTREPDTGRPMGCRRCAQALVPMTVRAAKQQRHAWRVLLQLGTRCSDRAFRSPAGSSLRLQTGVVNDRATLHAFARTALEQAARGDGIDLWRRIAPQQKVKSRR